MINRSDVIAYIQNQTDSNELMVLSQVIQSQSKKIASANRRKLYVGMNVYFDSRYGTRISGMIQKLNPKMARVIVPSSVPGGRPVIWKVPYNMLKVAEKDAA